MINFSGRRVAVAGLGVSGLSVCRAVKALGGTPVGLDQKPCDSPRLIKASDDLAADGIEVITSWNGRLDPAEFDLLVLSPGFPLDHPAVADMEGKPVWGEIEFAWQIAKAPILAITGTNGKSTVTTLTWLMLRAEGIDAKLCGNIAGTGFQEMTLTQAALEGTPDSVLVAEVSSFQLEQIGEFAPKAAVITNITEDHLDRHASFEEYRQAKMRLLSNMGPDTRIVWNSEDGTISADNLETAAAGAEIVEVIPTEFAVDVSHGALAGLHGQANAACAWALASSVCDLGAKSRRALLDFEGLENRLEPLGEIDGVEIINSSVCTNPAAFLASVGAVPKRQIVLIGGKTKGLDFGPVRELLESTEHEAVVFGSNVDELMASLNPDTPVFDDLQTAFKAALKMASPGDAVHLAPGCSSAAPFASFRERAEDFKRIVSEWGSG